MPDDAPPLELPPLDGLHERHFGLPRDLCRSFSQAARVCLARHHVPPTEFELWGGGGKSPRQGQLNWQIPSPREKAGWNNRDDATRDGAYAVALSAAECELKLFAVARAETRTGADYLLGTRMDSETDDLEAAFRLEVAGDDRGNLADIRRRLRRKVQQARDGESDLPALACVVGFEIRTVVFEEVGPADVD